MVYIKIALFIMAIAMLVDLVVVSITKFILGFTNKGLHFSDPVNTLVAVLTVLSTGIFFLIITNDIDPPGFIAAYTIVLMALISTNNPLYLLREFMMKRDFRKNAISALLRAASKRNNSHYEDFDSFMAFFSSTNDFNEDNANKMIEEINEAIDAGGRGYGFSLPNITVVSEDTRYCDVIDFILDRILCYDINMLGNKTDPLYGFGHNLKKRFEVCHGGSRMKQLKKLFEREIYRKPKH